MQFFVSPTGKIHNAHWQTKSRTWKTDCYYTINEGWTDIHPYNEILSDKRFCSRCLRKMYHNTRRELAYYFMARGNEWQDAFAQAESFLK